MSQPFHVHPFLGLRGSVALPNGKGASSMKNFIRNGVRGYLEKAFGYGTKFAESDEPMVGEMPAASEGMSSVVFQDIASMYVSEHGGKYVTIVVATCARSYLGAEHPETINGLAVWARPIWNGSAWEDRWDELTEAYYFVIASMDGTTKTLIHLEADNEIPTAVIGSDRLAGFLAFTNGTFKAAIADATGMLITGSAYGGGADPTLSYWGDNTSFATVGAGDILLVCRTNWGMLLPASTNIAITNILNELRITTGRTSTDLVLAVHFRTKTFDWDTVDKDVDSLLIEPACLDFWEHLFILMKDNGSVGNIGTNVVAETIDPLPVGYWYIRYSIVLDDGQESRLFTKMETDPTDDWVTFVSTNQKIEFYPCISPMWPKRGRYLRLYMSNDVEATYTKVVDIDLQANSGLSWNAVRLEHNVTEHYYSVRQTPFYITGSMWSAATDSPASNLQRSVDDTGVAQYEAAIFHGRTTLAIRPRIAGTDNPNKIAFSIQHGAGLPQWDVFTNSSLIDIEYSDGDVLVAIGHAGERIVALKKRSVVLLTEDGRGGYNRDIATSGVGCASRRSLVTFDDTSYWLDYSGFFAFSPSGLQFIGANIRKEILAISDSDKEAAVAVIDRKNKVYRCAIAGKEYIFDLLDNEWTIEELADQPLRYAVDLEDGLPMFLEDSRTTMMKLLLEGLHDGVNFSMDYTTTDIDPAKDDPSFPVGWDYLLQRIHISYESDLPLTLSVYLDESATPMAETYTCDAGDVDTAFNLPLSTRCRKWRIKIATATTADGQEVSIKKLSMTYGAVPPMDEVSI